MTDGDLVPLRCQAVTLQALSANLERFGPSEGAPDWLVSAVWMCTPDAQFIATAAVEVLSDGYLARSLNIHRSDELLTRLDEDLPDIQGRLISRGCTLRLPGVAETLAPPRTLQPWPDGSYEMKVLARVASSACAVHRVVCALLFTADSGRSMLVGTDTSTLAMVLTEDPELIARYRKGCEEFGADEFGGICEP